MKLHQQLNNSELFVEELSDAEMEAIQGGNFLVPIPKNCTSADLARWKKFVDTLNKKFGKPVYKLVFA